MPTRPKRASLQDAYVKAPLGGINTVDAAGAMPDTDAIFLNNLVAAEYGLRSRLGYQEWSKGITGGADNGIRSLIPFTGSQKFGTTDKLFAMTSSGIWDVTQIGAPTVAYQHLTTYAQGVLVTNAPAWVASFIYLVGDQVTNGGNTYVCVGSGRAAGSGGPTGVGAGIVDGGATWNYIVAPYVYAAQNAGVSGGTPFYGPIGMGFGQVDGSVTWNYVANNNPPVQLITFPILTGDAGRGTSTVAATPAGRFLLYCDEENGLYVYPEGGPWSRVVVGVNQPWQSQTFVAIGNKVTNGGNTYTCTTGGVTGNTGGPTGTGAGITDGATVVWTGVAGVTANSIGPSLSDQQAGFSGNPNNFANVTVWKSRVWFTEKNTSRGWYLDVNAIYGLATSFDFGAKMRAGGPLVGLYNWSFDGGSGLDTLLVGISTAGDIVIYEGTDPTSANTFGLKGTWYVPGVPYGRRVATDFGGDLLVLSNSGIIPLSKLIIGNPIVDRTQYTTYKVTNLFTNYMQVGSSQPGWAIHIHPTDNTLLVLLPPINNPLPGQVTQLTQLAMSLPTRGWSQYQNMPAVCACAWDGQFYFGTADGRVCLNTGYVDGALLDVPAVFIPITWSLLTAYQNLETMKNKRVRMVRPTVLSSSPVPVLAAAMRFNYDMSQPSLTLPVPTVNAGTWDAATWGGQVWAPLTAYAVGIQAVNGQNVYTVASITTGISGNSGGPTGNGSGIVDGGVTWNYTSTFTGNPVGSVWGGDYTPYQPMLGAAGMGRDAALVVQGQANGRTIFVGANILFEVGGYL